MEKELVEKLMKDPRFLSLVTEVLEEDDEKKILKYISQIKSKIIKKPKKAYLFFINEQRGAIVGAKKLWNNLPLENKKKYEDLEKLDTIRFADEKKRLEEEQEETKICISIHLGESLYYFPCEDTNVYETINLLKMLSCDNDVEEINGEYLYLYLNQHDVSIKNIEKMRLQISTLKYVLSSNENTYLEFAEDNFFERLIEFKNSDNFNTLKQMELTKDLKRFDLKNDIMKWIICG